MDNINASHRKRIKQLRKNTSIEEQSHKSEMMSQSLTQTNLFRNAKHIAFYLPVSGEADPTLVLDHPTSHRKQFYLPVISQLRTNHLCFAPIHSETVYSENQYGILEPVCHPKELLKPNQLDLILTPLVAFDRHGSRLGMGGGYYDRSFAFKLRNRSRKKPFLCGYAYDFQEVDLLVRQDWDVPLDGIISNNQHLLVF